MTSAISIRMISGSCVSLREEFEQKETKRNHGDWMHPHYAQAHALSGQIIGAAMEVHREKGPGLLDSIYERCLMHELSLRGHRAVNQQVVRISYKDLIFEEA